MYLCVCIHCGREFQSPVVSRKFCSRACYALTLRGSKRKELTDNDDGRHVKPVVRQCSLTVDAFLAEREARQSARLNYLRERDAAYAAWAADNGVTERVVVGDATTTICRGNICVGARAARTVNHNA